MPRFESYTTKSQEIASFNSTSATVAPWTTKTNYLATVQDMRPRELLMMFFPSVYPNLEGGYIAPTTGTKSNHTNSVSDANSAGTSPQKTTTRDA